jgi:hypothetical protein
VPQPIALPRADITKSKRCKALRKCINKPKYIEKLAEKKNRNIEGYERNKATIKANNADLIWRSDVCWKYRGSILRLEFNRFLVFSHVPGIISRIAPTVY